MYKSGMRIFSGSAKCRGFCLARTDLVNRPDPQRCFFNMQGGGWGSLFPNKMEQFVASTSYIVLIFILATQHFCHQSHEAMLRRHRLHCLSGFKYYQVPICLGQNSVPGSTLTRGNLSTNILLGAGSTLMSPRSQFFSQKPASRQDEFHTQALLPCLVL